MEDGHISLFADTSPGVQPDQPMAVVFTLGHNTSQEDFQIITSSQSPYPKYPQKLRARQNCRKHLNDRQRQVLNLDQFDPI